MSAPSPSEPAFGYTFLRSIGSGTYGDVYLATLARDASSGNSSWAVKEFRYAAEHDKLVRGGLVSYLRAKSGHPGFCIDILAGRFFAANVLLCRCPPEWLFGDNSRCLRCRACAWRCASCGSYRAWTTHSLFVWSAPSAHHQGAYMPSFLILAGAAVRTCFAQSMSSGCRRAC